MSILSIILKPTQLDYLAIWGVKHVDFDIILKPRQLVNLAIWGVKHIYFEHHSGPQRAGDGVKHVDFEHHSEAQTVRVSGDLGCQKCRF